MPNYDYTCLTCGKAFEIHHKMSEAAPQVAPGCNAQNCNLEKRLTAPASVVKSSNPLAGHSLSKASNAASNSSQTTDSSPSHTCGSGCTFHRH
jgi:putative FmdB family regulatory protein